MLNLFLTLDILLVDSCWILCSVCLFSCLIQTFLLIKSRCFGFSGIGGFIMSEWLQLFVEPQELPTLSTEVCSDCSTPIKTICLCPFPILNKTVSNTKYAENRPCIRLRPCPCSPAPLLHPSPLSPSADCKLLWMAASRLSTWDRRVNRIK